MNKRNIILIELNISNNFHWINDMLPKLSTVLKPSDLIVQQFSGTALIVILAANMYNGVEQLNWSLILIFFFFIGFFYPLVIRPVYVVAACLTMPIGVLVNLFLSAVFFYGVITPLGLIFRLMTKDPLRIKLHNDTMWIKRKASRDSNSYFHQY